VCARAAHPGCGDSRRQIVGAAGVCLGV